MFTKLLKTIGAILFAFFIYQVLMRLLRRYVKFPAPYFILGFIDRIPTRHWLQPPDDMPSRHGLRPGMKVLEIGPGGGTYTIATARYLGEKGHLTAVDIEPRVIDALSRRIESEGVGNIACQVADVSHLPFNDGQFDAVYLMSVLGELPDLKAALAEFHRVLKPGGVLAISELLIDPDYFLPAHLVRRMGENGFVQTGDWPGIFQYTMTFQPV